MRTHSCLCSLAVLLATGALVCTNAWALDPKAVPVQAPVWAAPGAGASYNPNSGTAAKPVFSVVLNNNATVLNWNSFNIGKDATVQFQMPASTARVLNNVTGGALTPTQIDGMLNANGQVYIYDPRGMVFSKGSQVNVNSLVASSLRVDPDRFVGGILVPSVNPIFAMDPALGYMPGAVVVQGDANGGALQRAAITAQQNGFILLAAPQVQNAGDLKAPDGQVVLASGSKVYLAAPTESSMRGFKVEVSNEGLSNLAASAANASNTVGGVIDVQRGNATMVGMAVNQMGLVSATTSVNLNGSIWLHARGDTQVKGHAGDEPAAVHTGVLVLGPNSRTVVSPDLQDTATAPVQPNGPGFKPSQIELIGQTIALQGSGSTQGAAVSAPGGTVVLSTNVAGAAPSGSGPNPLANIVLQEGSSIDVSGSVGVQVAMESNVISAELRGNELADNPLLRNSALRGQTVYFDVRNALASAVDPTTGSAKPLNPADLTGVTGKDDPAKGPLSDIASNASIVSLAGVGSGMKIANTTGYVQQLQRSVGQDTAMGGTVSLYSEGSVAIRQGSSINVSGGSVDYQTGYVNTTKLTLAGKLYDIATAPADLPYDGLVRLPNSSQNLVQGYSQGASAGAIRILAPQAVIEPGAALLAGIRPGVNQRDLSALDAPRGGTLTVGDVLQKAGSDNGMALNQQVTIGLPSPTSPSGAPPMAVQKWADAGFSAIEITSMQGIDAASGLVLGANGTLKLVSNGDVNLNSVSGAGATLIAQAPLGTVRVQDGAHFNLAGLWQNDSPSAEPLRDGNSQLSEPIATKGGNLNLTANTVLVGNSVQVDVSGGAWLDNAGAVRDGKAGSISLTAQNATNAALDTRLVLGADVVLSGFGLKSGASLTLGGRNVWLGNDVPTGFDGTQDLWLAPGFFEQGGFTKYTVAASGNLTLAADTALAPVARSWVLDSNFAQIGSGAMALVSDAGATTVLPLAGPAGARPATSLTLKAGKSKEADQAVGVLRLERGSSISVDPGAKVSLQALQALAVEGSVSAPGGTIALSLVSDGDPIKTGASEVAPKIWVGTGASLDVSGTADRTWVDGRGITQGSLLAGGSVLLGRVDDAGTLGAALGAIEMAPGATVKANGASAVARQVMDGTQTSAPQTLASDAGSISMSSSVALLVSGSLQALAGGDAARGGKLTISLPASTDAPHPALILGSAPVDNVWNSSLVFGDSRASAAYAALVGNGWINTPSFDSGGFERLSLASGQAIVLSPGLNLQSSGSIRLDAPVLRAGGAADAAATMTVKAPSVSMGPSLPQTPAIASGASGSNSVMLSVQSDTLDLQGNTATQGFSQVQLQASHDVRLLGETAGGGAAPSGLFATGPKLDIQAAQVYPTTLSDFTMALTGANTRLTIGTQGASATPGDVLSAGGAVHLVADTITQGGRLLAPSGRIDLQATDTITYTAGSVTSVAGSATVLFGTVENGASWSYSYGGNTGAIAFGADPSTGLSSLPLKKISSTAATVVQAPGAILDAVGGGNLYGYGVAIGPGGSSDILNAPGTFAINPKFRGLTAPLDANSGSAGLQVGDQIYLSATAALPAGYYTLLPAHYALLDGGMAVVATGVSASAQDNRLNADGSFTVAGMRSSSTDGRGDTRMSAFKLLTGTEVRRRTEFQDYNADSFFSAQAAALGVRTPDLPRDAGQLSFQVSHQLDLAGQSLLQGANAAGYSGHAGLVDISAPAITVTADTRTEVSGTVRLLADQLNALGADSLLLGGRRTLGADGMHLQVDASSVRIDNDRAHPLQGLELLMVAHDTVEVTGRASLAAQSMVAKGGGAVAQTAVDLNLVGTDAEGVVYGTGAQADGAMLRLSSAGAVSIRRDTPAGDTGRLLVNTGAQLSGSGSVALDATQDMSFQPSLNLAPGSAFSAHSRGINLGNVSQPDLTPGLSLDNATLAKLNALSVLDLVSYSGITSYGNVTLGSNNMQALRLQTGSFSSDGGNLALKGQSVALSGLPTASVAPNAEGGAGQLSIVAGKTLVLGDGTLQVQGFATTDITAAKGIALTGGALQLMVDNALTLHSPLITADPGTVAHISSGAAMLIDTAAGAADPALGSGLGAKLEFSTLSQSLTVNTSILAKGGQIALKGAQGVAVNAGTLDVSGVSMAFGSGMAYAPAGSIQVDAGQGSLTLAQAAVLDLSATGADAGSLDLRATGSSAVVSLDAVLRGTALAGVGSAVAANPLQASFSLDAFSAPAEFDALNATLNASGFTQSRTVRVRSGDLAVGAGSTITGRSIAMSTDNGNLTVAGTLDASGPSGGAIDLFAASAGSANTGHLSLTGATLIANATQASTSAAGSLGDGGRVTLGVSNTGSTGGAVLDLDADTRISTQGAGQGSNGEVRLRAPVNAGKTDVAVSALLADVQTGALILEAVQTYNVAGGSTLGSSDVVVYKADANTFMARAGAVQSRLADGHAPAVQVQPGVEVRSSGDLTVSVNEQDPDPSRRGWDLSTWRFGSAQVPVNLTLRAAGDLTVNGSISDGFVKGPGALSEWVLGGGNSASMRFVAGAELAAAAPLMTHTALTGNFELGFGTRHVVSSSDGDGNMTYDVPLALLRTGTGRIDVAAGNNLILGSLVWNAGENDSMVSQVVGASIYTAGQAAVVRPADFVPPSGATFGANGGAISLSAGGDVVGMKDASLNTAVNTVANWLFRQGNGSTVSTAWWSQPGYLGAGVATLGGGDLSVRSRTGSVMDLGASVATNAYVRSDGVLVEQGGGDLQVRAGKDIAGGQFYVQKGQMALRADGSVIAGQATGMDDRLGLLALRPVLALGDAQAQVTAGRNLEIDAIYNPTLAYQSANNAPSDSSRTYFMTYGPQSAVQLNSVGGDVLFNDGAYLLAGGGTIANSIHAGQQSSDLLNFVPATIGIAALSGSVKRSSPAASVSPFVMAPSPTGNLSIYAQQSIAFDNQVPISMLDSDPGALGSVKSPSAFAGEDINAFLGDSTGLSAHLASGLHTGDLTPVRVVALRGDITGSNGVGGVLDLPKRLEMAAGRDILDVGFSAQHLSSTDVSTVIAGRDIRQTGANKNDVQQSIAGPGLLVLDAGGSIDLGLSRGVVTRGNLDNTYLPKGGAAIEAVAGTVLSSDFLARSPADVERENAAWFSTISSDYAAAQKAGTSAIDAFDAAIWSLPNAHLDPKDPLYKAQSGSISLTGSQFKTEQGGSIDLWAPAGSVVAGAQAVSSSVQEKLNDRSQGPSTVGVFTIQGGSVRSLVSQDFLVNQGRVFTLSGGDITLISQYGNIDAGKGAKTSASAPPPLLTTDASGNTKLDLAGSISGSGIATLRTSDTQAPSNVVALAPRGIFDAGDAGVRSTGKVQIEAAVVLNANNISASGGVSGSVAVASVASVAAPSTDTASTATQSAAKQSSAPAAPTLALTVDVLGYGDVNAAPGKDDGQDDGLDADETDANGQKKRKSTKKP